MFWHFIAFEFSKYIVLVAIIIFWYMFQKKEIKRREEIARTKLYREYPLISVVVPGKNEGPNIYKLAHSLKRQTYQNYEVIIVDDGSDDDTYLICKDLLKRKIIDMFISNPDRGGKASAANTALKFSKGKYVIHLDADSHLRDDAIETILLPFYMDENVGAVGGDVRVNNVEDSIVTALQGIEYLKSITIGRFIADKLDIMRLISGAYGAFRMDILKRIGGWDVGPGLDGDITLKIRKLGFRVVFNIESVCYTNAPTKFKALAKQRFRWDRSIIRFRLRKHVNILFSKHFNIPLKMAIIDNLAYNFLFDFFWFAYMVSVIMFFTSNLGYIILTNYLLYIMENYIKFGIIIFFIGDTLRKKDYLAVLFIPLIPFYTGIFLKLVRIYAHMMELLFRVSYYDKWNPWKVSRVVKEKGL
jgi:cellulose synthase/poly-beta-1,6-N-acetylglucosamine synthase-like glycosyltransferase